MLGGGLGRAPHHLSSLPSGPPGLTHVSPDSVTVIAQQALGPGPSLAEPED